MANHSDHDHSCGCAGKSKITTGKVPGLAFDDAKALDAQAMAADKACCGGGQAKPEPRSGKSGCCGSSDRAGHR